MYRTTNDLIYALALRARRLGDFSIATLRSLAEDEPKHFTRGQLIEAILVGEFIEEFPKEITNE